MTDLIKARLIELVPEIMETTFGCRVLMISKEGTQYSTRIIDRWLEPDKTYWYKVVGHDGQNWEVEDFDKILGHPITLPDILRAIRKSKTRFLKSPDLKRLSEYDGITDLIDMFDLTTDYDNQDQPTKDFIGKLIGVV